MRSRVRFAIAALAFLTAAVVLLGDRRSATNPDQWGRTQAPAAEPEAPRELQVATFNIHGCKGLDGRRDVDRVAKCLEGLDIVGLNEVHGWRWTDPPDQAAHLAQLCNLPAASCVYAPAETRWFGAKRFGNGLLTKQALLSWQRIPLPHRYDHSYRNVLLAKVAWHPKTLSLLIAHVTRSDQREREIQLETVLELFESLTPPAVLLADLNTPPDDPRMVEFLSESDAADAIKQGGVPGADRVDWILVRGLTCLESNRVDTEASDHALFVARLQRPEPTGETVTTAEAQGSGAE